MKENNMEYYTAKKVIAELAKEINDMTEKEKQLSLQKIVQVELKVDSNFFWTTIAKKMLVSKELRDRIIWALSSDTEGYHC
jgi:hypothetical protein